MRLRYHRLIIKIFNLILKFGRNKVHYSIGPDKKFYVCEEIKWIYDLNKGEKSNETP